MVQQYEHISMVSKIVVKGLRRWWSSSRSNSASKQARDLFFLNPRFLGMGNHLGPFSGASDQSEGQEQAVQAVGGQGSLCGVTQLGVTQLLSMLET